MEEREKVVLAKKTEYGMVMIRYLRTALGLKRLRHRDPLNHASLGGRKSR